MNALFTKHVHAQMLTHTHALSLSLSLTHTHPHTHTHTLSQTKCACMERCSLIFFHRHVISLTHIYPYIDTLSLSLALTKLRRACIQLSHSHDFSNNESKTEDVGFDWISLDFVGLATKKFEKLLLLCDSVQDEPVWVKFGQ